jgi:sortase A
LKESDAVLKKLSWLLIILGLVIAMIPVTGQLYNSYRQRRLMADWESMPGDYENGTTDPAEAYGELQDIFTRPYEESASGGDLEEIWSGPVQRNEQAADLPDSSQDTGAAAGTSEKKAAPKPDVKVIGRLKIKKIKVDVPVVEGVSSANLRVGVGRIPGTSNIGEVGNTAIAGHRSYTFGRFFNRLNEVEPGDEIIIETKNGEYVYTVYEKKIVEPSDVSVLKRNKTEKVLTLITCEPIYVASHRLIIHARIQ